MGARTSRPAGGRGRLSVIVFVLAALLASPSVAIEAPAGAADVAVVEGAGWSSKFACLACAGTLAGLGGGTIGGVLLLTALAPEAVAGCVYICYTAY